MQLHLFLTAFLWCFIFWRKDGISSAAEPGYLDFDNLPETNFSCEGKVIGGYYADIETGCQMFHVCTIGQKGEVTDIKFLCLNGTVFDQETRVCERLDEVDCSKSESFFDLNLELYGNKGHFGIEPENEDIAEEECNPEDDEECQKLDDSEIEDENYENEQQTTYQPPLSTSTTKRPQYPTGPPPLPSPPTRHHQHYHFPSSTSNRPSPSSLPLTTTTSIPTTTTTTPPPPTTTGVPQVIQYPSSSPETIAALLALHNAFQQSLQLHDLDSKEQQQQQQQIKNQQNNNQGIYHHQQQQQQQTHTVKPSIYQFQQQTQQTLPRPPQTIPTQSNHHFPLQRPQQHQTQLFQPIRTSPQSPGLQSERFGNLFAHQQRFQTQNYPHNRQQNVPVQPTLPPPRTERPKPFSFHQQQQFDQESNASPYLIHQLRVNRLKEEQQLQNNQHGTFIRQAAQRSLQQPQQAAIAIVTSTSTTTSVRSGNSSNGAINKHRHLDNSDNPYNHTRIPPTSYDEYQESDVQSDPFFHDVPKISRSRRDTSHSKGGSDEIKIKTMERFRNTDNDNMFLGLVSSNDRRIIRRGLSTSVFRDKYLLNNINSNVRIKRSSNKYYKNRKNYLFNKFSKNKNININISKYKNNNRVNKYRKHNININRIKRYNIRKRSLIDKSKLNNNSNFNQLNDKLKKIDNVNNRDYVNASPAFKINSNKRNDDFKIIVADNENTGITKRKSFIIRFTEKDVANNKEKSEGMDWQEPAIGAESVRVGKVLPSTGYHPSRNISLQYIINNKNATLLSLQLSPDERQFFNEVSRVMSKYIVSPKTTLSVNNNNQFQRIIAGSNRFSGDVELINCSEISSARDRTRLNQFVTVKQKCNNNLAVRKSDSGLVNLYRGRRETDENVLTKSKIKTDDHSYEVSEVVDEPTTAQPFFSILRRLQALNSRNSPIHNYGDSMETNYDSEEGMSSKTPDDNIITQKTSTEEISTEEIPSRKFVSFRRRNRTRSKPELPKSTDYTTSVPSSTTSLPRKTDRVVSPQRNFDRFEAAQLDHNNRDMLSALSLNNSQHRMIVSRKNGYQLRKITTEIPERNTKPAIVNETSSEPSVDDSLTLNTNNRYLSFRYKEEIPKNEEDHLTEHVHPVVRNNITLKRNGNLNVRPNLQRTDNATINSSTPSRRTGSRRIHNRTRIDQQSYGRKSLDNNERIPINVRTVTRKLAVTTEIQASTEETSVPTRQIQSNSRRRYSSRTTVPTRTSQYVDEDVRDTAVDTQNNRQRNSNRRNRPNSNVNIPQTSLETVPDVTTIRSRKRINSGNSDSPTSTLPTLTSTEKKFDDVKENEGKFTCEGRVRGGLYADLKTDCRGFYICAPATPPKKYLIATHFWCGQGTKFNQETRICHSAHLVDCSTSPQFYSLNDNSNPTPDDEKNTFEPKKI